MKMVIFNNGTIFLSGYMSQLPTLSMPVLNENKALITHIKKPMISVLDIKKNKVIHEEYIDFSLNSLARIGDDKLVIAGKLETDVLLLNLKNGKTLYYL